MLVRRFVEAFNTHDLEKVRAFRAANMAKRPGGPTDEERDQVARRMWNDFGSLTIVGVLAEDEQGIDVRMKGASGPAARFRFFFTPEDRIGGLMIEGGD